MSNYSTIHRLETNKLRNVAKLFSHLLYTDALPWTCLGVIRLNEDDTTSSSRIFIKVLAQELSENMGIATLRARFSDPYMADTFRLVEPQQCTEMATHCCLSVSVLLVEVPSSILK